MSANQLRGDGRRPNQLRPVRITRRFLKHPEGSCLIEVGDTRVLCAATVEAGVPHWLEGAGRGWVTAEYAMLPRATQTRTPREGRTGRPPGRTMEIQRLIGRSLRAVCDLDALDNRRVTVDCDVIQADGGTRAAAITGAYVALRDALAPLNWPQGCLPLLDCVVGLSAGIVANRNLLDLCYLEDAEAAVDMTFAFTGEGLLVEVQGTGEGRPFAPAEMTALLELARPAAATLAAMVKQLFDRDLPAIRTHDGA